LKESLYLGSEQRQTMAGSAEHAGLGDALAPATRSRAQPWLQPSRAAASVTGIRSLVVA
jgi:hypothetical protein